MAGHGCLASSIGHILRSPASRWAFRLRQQIHPHKKVLHRSLSTCRPAADSRKIDPPDVRQLAKMAHIDVTDEEVHFLQPLQFCLPVRAYGDDYANNPYNAPYR